MVIINREREKMSEWKKLLLGVAIFGGLSFISGNDWGTDAQAESEATYMVSSGLIEKSNTIDDYEVVDTFTLAMNERANVWLEKNSVVILDGSVIYIAKNSDSMVFSECGNYLILDKIK